MSSKVCFFILEDMVEYKIRYANDIFLNLLGYSHVDSLIDLLSAKEKRDLVEITRKHNKTFDFRCVLTASDRYIGALLRFSKIGQTFYCCIEDYEDDTNYIKRLEFENDRLSALVELSGSMLAEFDASGVLVFATSSVFKEFDVKPFEEGILNALSDGFVLRDDISKAVKFIRDSFTSQVERSCELRLRASEGYKWFNITARGILNSKECLSRVIVKAEDIEVYKVRENMLRMKIELDDLTQCYKKSFLVEELSGKEVGGCLAFFDIDNFKGINDTYGHLEGDRALVGVAKSCKSVFCSDEDIICRFGGDEFCIYSRNSDRDSFEHNIQVVQSKVRKLEICGENPISISVGIVVATPTLSSIQTLLDVADMTLYVVKEHGKNSYKFFDELK